MGIFMRGKDEDQRRQRDRYWGATHLHHSLLSWPAPRGVRSDHRP